MKIIFTILPLILLSFTTIQPPLAPIVWEEDLLYDFGDIIHAQPVEVAFNFRNIGADSLWIDNVRTSCGCTTPDWDEIAIAPDSMGVIRIEYDAEDLGYFSKSIKVFFNGYRKAEKLKIEGYVVEH